MTIRRGDEIKIRSYNSIKNEFGEDGYNPRFLGWGKSVVYVGFEHIGRTNKLKVMLDDRLVTVNCSSIENSEHKIYVGMEVPNGNNNKNMPESGNHQRLPE